MAIVIPFYKIDFFGALLERLAAQTDKDFVVYVGNDASVVEAEQLIKSFSGRLDVRYNRFEKNIGRYDLAGQWNRCVSLAGDEEWLWVIGDDDLPSTDCVAEIRKASLIADEAGAHVIHIPGIVINSNGDQVGTRADFPSVLNSGKHYIKQLRGEAMSMTLANSVYRRSAFEETGQFKSYPQGWGSDHATPLAVAAGGPFVTVDQASLGFRMSGINISSKVDDVAEKMQGRLLYGEWLSGKAWEWYDEATARELLWRVYLKTELQVTKYWPFNLDMARKLFGHAETCGVSRSILQKAMILKRGYLQNTEDLLGR